MTMTEPSTEKPCVITCSNLLNIYLREISLLYPQDCLMQHLDHEDVRSIIGLPLSAERYVNIALPRTGGCLIGTLETYSVSGHHRFGAQLWHKPRNEALSDIRSTYQLAVLLLIEFVEHPDSPQFTALVEAVENSLTKTSLYREAAQQAGKPAHTRELHERFIVAEQGLVFGHPFHPTPKSSEGFTSADLADYAPELGAAFVLEYLAVDPSFVGEDFLSEASEAVIPADVQGAATVQLGRERQHWKLLPCHPWQARYLQNQPAIQAMIAQGQLMMLGALGATAYPTSSVRTVIVPNHHMFFKLPLNVRITNFTRINPLEHVRRSMDASRAVSIASTVLPATGFRFLKELGYRTVCPPVADGEALSGSFAVLFREKPFAIDVNAPLVLAGLLEPCPISGKPLLLEYLLQAAAPRGLDQETIVLWVRRYLQIGLLPILDLFLKRGISLEAHVQNTLVTLNNGWPETVYVRDLEGVSISRELAISGGWYDQILAPESPALYDEADAWHRLKYYVIVNQLSHLLATIGHITATSEAILWETTRRWLLEQPSLQENPRSQRYLIDLVDSPTLPAKANLISRFQGRAETPIYVPIANPLNVK